MRLDVIVVLGQALFHDGSLRKSLHSRISAGANLWVTMPESLIVMTGGDVAQTGVSEAIAMKSHLIQLLHNECCESKILLETNSKSTVENAINCRALLEQCNICVGKLHLVTSDFHIPRARCVFQHVFSNSGPKHSGDVEVLCYGADSGLARTSVVRDFSTRPKNIDDWSFIERLDLEKGGILNLVNQFAGHGVGGPSQDKIHQALNDISQLIFDIVDGNGE